MTTGLLLFLISILLMLVSSAMITMVLHLRKKKAESNVREKLREQNNEETRYHKTNIDGFTEKEREVSPEPDEQDNNSLERNQHRITYRVIMKLSISVVIISVGLYIILSNKFGEEDKKWAYGSVGTIIGYWFK